MTDIGDQVANRVKELRISQGLTQEQLAERAEIDPSVLSRIERGSRTNVRLETLDKLVRALNVDYGTFFSFSTAANQTDRLAAKLSLVHDQNALSLIEQLIDYTLDKK
ncbi:helix-turn-helix domain-containing protein [uncultured Lacticaseibacillus sp.]|uniref:helix-turn-helix domain-containing protein n=1 Tax=uncultured Lacticaseibacillus sp. TaxID=2775882 RepID=UPI002591EE17|nr:helix-turn-helix transcriptional regulator [uncultured Lacticaseibacillus sp.]